MSTPWTISAAAERVELNAQRQGQITFTVTNPGPTDDRAVVDVVPGENANRAWFTVDEPQRMVTHGGSATFLAKIAVPPDAPAGLHWLTGRVYSASAAPEETSRLSDRVAFEIKPSAPRKRNICLWLIPVAVLLLAVLAVVVFLLLRDGDPNPTPPTTTTTPTAAPVVHRSGPMDIQQTFLADLDALVTGGLGQEMDIFFRARTATERFVEPQNGATIAEVGPTGDAVRACSEAALTGTPIPIAGLAAGDVFCVRTTEGRLSVVTVNEPVGPSPGRLRVSVTTFQP